MNDAAALAVVKAIDRLGDEVRELRLVVQASGIMIHAALAPAPAGEMGTVPAGCVHPEDERIAMASRGNDDFYCKACSKMVLRPLADVER